MCTNEPTVPDGERIYRRLKPEDVEDGVVMARSLDEPPRWNSFNRGSLGDPESVLLQSTPEYTGIAESTVAAVSFEVPREDREPLETFVAPDPKPPENLAHCEVRVKRKGFPYSRNYRNFSDTEKKAIRVRIASALRIYREPT